VETPRRGTETAHTGCAVSAGAEWLQGVVDLHRPDAGRILDLPHALSDGAQAGQAGYGEGTAALTPWVTRQRQTLQHGDPGEGIRALRQLGAPAKRCRAEQAVVTGQASVASLERRRARLNSAWCQARGYPLGSGAVARANTLVGDARLKGAGRHWARGHGHPRVARRAMACSDRWAAAWPQIAQQVRQQVGQGQRQRQSARRQRQALAPLAPRPTPPSVVPPSRPAAEPRPAPRRFPAPPPAARTGAKGPYRPPPDHPWRRCRISWKQAQ
jgi:hypothetical protein